VGVIYLGFSVETREAARAAGVKLDAQEALSYFKRACEAQYARGCYYVGSQIVGLFPSKKERAEAFPWYAAACDLGDADGCEKAIEAAPVEKIEGLQHKACELGRKQYCPAPETLLQWRLLAGSRFKIHVERIKRIRMSQLKTMTEDMIMDLVLEIKTVDDVGNGHGLLRFDYLGRRISLGKSDKGLRERVPKERLATYELPCELSRAGLIRFDKNSANSLFPDYKDLASILYRVFPPLADRVVTVGTVWAFEVDDVTVRMKYARFDGENLVLEGGGTSEKPGRMPTGSDTSYSNADTIAAWFNPTDLYVTGVVWVDNELTKVGEQTSQQYEKISVRVKKQEAGTRPSEKD
jgi:hypothetical protein